VECTGGSLQRYFLINKGTLFGYNLNGGNAKRASPGLHVAAEKGAFGLRTECFLLPAKIQILSL